MMEVSIDYPCGTAFRVYSTGVVELARVVFGTKREAAAALRRYANALDPLPETPPPPAARTGDPETSQQSAGSRGLRLDQVKPGHRSHRLLMQYRIGVALDDNRAGRAVAETEQMNPYDEPPIERVKACARLCTELRRLGLIERVDVFHGRMRCNITDAGLRHLGITPVESVS